MKKIIILHSFFLFYNSFLNAQWPTTPDTGLVVGYGDFPAIISDNDGGAIVAFRANNPSQIKVKRVDKYGYLQWNGFSGVVAGGIEDWQDFHSITEDGRGGVLAAFQDIDCYENCDDIPPMQLLLSFVTVQRIDHQGNKLWGEGVRVSAKDTIFQKNTIVQSDNEAGCIVSWRENNSIYMQRLDSLGTRLWGDTGIVVGNTVDKYVMVTDRQGSSFIQWTESYQPVWIDRMQKINKFGAKLWSESGLITSHSNKNIAIINNQGGFIIAGLQPSSYQSKISCQNYDSLGNKLWGDNDLTLADSVDYYYANISDLLFDNYGNTYISFYHKKSGQYNIVIQKIDNTGNKLFGLYGMSPSLDTSSKNGCRMVLYDDSLLCAWNDARGGTYCQKLDMLGNIIWNEDKQFSTRGIGINTDDRIGGIIKLHGGSDFSFNLIKISKNGNIGQVLVEIKDQDEILKHNEFILHQNYPNPFNPSTTISYKLNSNAYIKLELYNTLGQLVKVLVNKYQSMGNYSIKLDMSNYSSGLYFYRLNCNNHNTTKKLLYVK